MWQGEEQGRVQQAVAFNHKTVSILYILFFIKLNKPGYWTILFFCISDFFQLVFQVRIENLFFYFMFLLNWLIFKEKHIRKSILLLQYSKQTDMYIFIFLLDFK